MRPEAERPDRDADQDGPRRTPEDSERWLRAGLVGRPHGLDGSFHVREPTPQLLKVGTRVRTAGQEWTIARRAGDPLRPIVRLEGCDGRDSVESLRGQELMVRRSQAPALDEDEWWEADLVGCAVRDGERAVGTVRRLLGLPTVDVLEVARAEGQPDLLVPLVKAAVRNVDAEAKVIDVDLKFLGAAD